MSQINVNNIRAKDGVGAVGFPGGINATGVVTATTFKGALEGNVTGNVTGNADTASNLTGSPSITVTNITAAGNVSIAGTLTYEDVTNIDAVGVVTARAGVNISGGNLQVGGTNVINSGCLLYTSPSSRDGLLSRMPSSA